MGRVACVTQWVFGHVTQWVVMTLVVDLVVIDDDCHGTHGDEDGDCGVHRHGLLEYVLGPREMSNQVTSDADLSSGRLTVPCLRGAWYCTWIWGTVPPNQGVYSVNSIGRYSCRRAGASGGEAAGTSRQSKRPHGGMVSRHG